MSESSEKTSGAQTSSDYNILETPNFCEGLTQNERYKLLLFLDFTKSSYYPSLYGDEPFETVLQKIGNCSANPSKSKNKTKSTSAKKNKSKNLNTQGIRGKEAENQVSESAKSLEVKKVIAWIHESLKRSIMGDTFLKYCEAQIHTKTAESKQERLESCIKFFESSSLADLELGSIIPEIDHLPPLAMSDAIWKSIQDNKSLQQRWVQWKGETEVPTATCQLQALKEAVMLLKKPLIEFHETQMQTLKQQEKAEKQSMKRLEAAKIRSERRRGMHRTNAMAPRSANQEALEHLASMFKRLSDTQTPQHLNLDPLTVSHETDSRMTTVQKTIFRQYRHMADSSFFPETDHATIFREKLTSFRAISADMSPEDFEANFHALCRAVSTHPDLQEAHKVSIMDLRSDRMIKDITDYCESPSFKELPGRARSKISTCLSWFTAGTPPAETNVLVNRVANIVRKHPDLREAFPKWQSSTPQTVAAKDFQECWHEQLKKEQQDSAGAGSD